jgi:hypothetical protein
MQNLMNISAFDLKENCPSKLALNKEVMYHLRAMERAIKDAHLVKQRHIHYELPINFSIPNTKNCDAQRYIYASIIDQFQLNGYDVRLNLTREFCKLYVTWITKLDNEEIRRQEDIINNARVRG